MIRRLAVAGALLAMVNVGWGDDIRVGGKAYTDVLIHTSSTLYYVTVPEEGRVVTVLKSEVDPSTVSIVDDPIYRDKRKAVYDENRESPKGKAYQSLDESQVVADAKAAVAAANDAQYQTRPDGEIPEGGGVAAGGSATAEGLGVSAAELQQAVQGAGVTMTQQGTQAGHPKYFGKTPSGDIQVDAYGPEENLKNITIAVTAAMAVQGLPDPAQIQQEMMAIQQKVTQVTLLLNNVAPWASNWMAQNFAAFLNTGKLETTQNYVHILYQIGQTGTRPSVTILVETAS